MGRRLWEGTAVDKITHALGVDSAFSPDGSKFVTVGESLNVWDTKSGAKLLDLKGHQVFVVRVAFSPDGSHIVTGGINGAIRLWDAKTGVEVLTLKGHAGSIVSIDFSPDGSRIVSGSDDGTVRIWGVRPITASPPPAAAPRPRSPAAAIDAYRFWQASWRWTRHDPILGLP